MPWHPALCLSHALHMLAWVRPSGTKMVFLGTLNANSGQLHMLKTSYDLKGLAFYGKKKKIRWNPGPEAHKGQPAAAAPHLSPLFEQKPGSLCREGQLGFVGNGCFQDVP